MARIRYIKPEFFDDPVLAGCSQGARLLFIALWQVADKSGVFDPDCRKLKKYAFGYDESISANSIDKMLSELVDIRAVIIGEFEGKPAGLVVNLQKHQKFHKDEKAHLEHVASTLLQGCKQGATILEAGRVTGNGELVTRNGERVTETSNGDPAKAPEQLTLVVEDQKPTKTRKPKTPTAPDATAPVGMPLVVEAWFNAYRAKYNSEAKWGARQGKQLKTLLGTYKPDELVDLIRHFFAWKRPEVIRAGHSFCTGYACFIAKLDELRADMSNPERRIEAAQASNAERNANKQASGISQAERLAMRFTGEKHDAINHEANGPQRLLGFGEANIPHV